VRDRSVCQKTSDVLGENPAVAGDEELDALIVLR
jgi:hypothetical protein